MGKAIQSGPPAKPGVLTVWCAGQALAEKDATNVLLLSRDPLFCPAKVMRKKYKEEAKSREKR